MGFHDSGIFGLNVTSYYFKLHKNSFLLYTSKSIKIPMCLHLTKYTQSRKKKRRETVFFP